MRLDAVEVRSPLSQMIFEVAREALPGATYGADLAPHAPVDPASRVTFGRRVFLLNSGSRFSRDEEAPLRRVDLVRTVEDFDRE